MGTAWLLDGLWRQLGVDTALAKVLGGRRFTTDVERVLFALVANRAIDPMSKLAAAEWASNDVALAGLEAMDEDQAYRAMDLLVAADAQAEVQEAVFFAVADLLNLEVDLLFFDTTSTYFERDTEEDDGAFRRYGHSKDHRPDLPQIVIGLAVTREGIPVRVWCWPGNTNDQTVLPEVKDGLRGWRLGRVVTVVDRGFSSDANLAYLRRAGGHWIAGERMRDGSTRRPEALARQGRYQRVRDNLRVKEVRLDATPAKRWIVCHNPGEGRTRQGRTRRRGRSARSRARTPSAKARARDAATRQDQTDARRSPRTRTDAPSAPCATTAPSAADLRQTAHRAAAHRPGQDRRRGTPRRQVPAVHRDPDLSAEDVALGYKNLLEAERGFRDLKSTLELRPVFHRIEPRIRAHVLLCWLALLLIRVAERRAGRPGGASPPNSVAVHAVTLQGPPAPSMQTTPLTDTAAGFLGACGGRSTTPHHPPAPRLNRPNTPTGQPRSAWTHAARTHNRAFPQVTPPHPEPSCAPPTAEPGVAPPHPPRLRLVPPRCHPTGGRPVLGR